MIPQHLKNLAEDTDIIGLIPRAFTPLLVVAAASKDIGAQADRHQFLAAIPAYLNRLPNNVQLAVEVIAMDAAGVLGIAGFATDAKTLTSAQEKLADAEAQVAQAEAIQGQRLTKIYQLEKEIDSLTANLESWQIDFDGQIADAEKVILENWGVQNVDGQFVRIARFTTLKRLAPAAISDIKARLERAEKDLAGLTAKPTAAKSIREPALV